MDDFKSVRMRPGPGVKSETVMDENLLCPSGLGDVQRGTPCSHRDLEIFSSLWGFQLRLGGLGAVAVSRDVLVRGLV